MSTTRVLRILTLLAVLLAPLGMIGGHAAMALPAPLEAGIDHATMMDPAGHCADRERPSQDRPASSIDCMIACSALPTVAGVDLDLPQPTAVEQTDALAAGLHGLHPESDPPPPRLS